MAKTLPGLPVARTLVFFARIEESSWSVGTENTPEMESQKRITSDPKLSTVCLVFRVSKTNK